MQLHLIAVGERMPGWVARGFAEYAGRFPPHLPLRLAELPLARRGRRDEPQRCRRDEGERLLAAVPPRARLLALDAGGRQWSTEELAAQLENWLQDGRDLAFVVGGPDGLSRDCRARAEHCWSLSRLTLPHMLVRVVVAEQLYRAWTVLQNHPYHR